MAQSILIFDFGTNEEAAQQARHKLEAWQQGSRLGKKILLKFDREESVSESESEPVAASAEVSAPASPAKGKSAKNKSPKHDEVPESDGTATIPANVRLVIRLDFSDHEKLTQQRWLDRFAAEEPFKSAKGETIRQGNPNYAKSAELFESLS